MRLKTTALLGTLGVLLALVGGAPAVSAPRATAGPTAAAAATVSVVLKDGKLAVAAKSAVAGKVTFVVKNTGKQKHDFYVIRSSKNPRALPMKGKKAALVGVKGKLGSVGPKQTKRLTLNLAPGKYVLICNQAGHYKRGEFRAFTVKAGTTTTVTPQTTEVNVSLFEMGFKLSKTTVPRGTVIFNLKNDGKLPHDMSFGSKGGGSVLLTAGQTAKFTVKFATPGKYTFICTVEGHQEAGMIGVLTVT